jgi:hypothetical protein
MLREREFGRHGLMSVSAEHAPSAISVLSAVGHVNMQGRWSFTTDR